MKKILLTIAVLSTILALALIFTSENLTGASIGKDKFAAPDLIISVWASKTTPLSTDNVVVYVKVKNRGGAKADKTVVELIDMLNDKIIQRWNLETPGLETSEVYTAQVSTSFIKGKHTLTALADADNRIEEIGEDIQDFKKTNNKSQYIIISE